MHHANNIRKDYKKAPLLPLNRTRLSKTVSMMKKHLHWVLLIGGVAVLGMVFGVMPNATDASHTTALPVPLQTGTTMILEIPTSATVSEERIEEPVSPSIEWRTLKVKKNDNLSTLFARQGLNPQTTYRVMNAGDAAKQLTQLFPGDELRLRIDEEGRLFELAYQFELTQTLYIRQQEDEFLSEIVVNPLERRVAQATHTIHDSLFLSAQAAGLSDRTTMELATLFGWDIDFALDIRRGDSFTLLYEELYQDGEKLRNGKIIAAEFINRGKSYRAIYFDDEADGGDYYSPDGKSMRKAFLRTPVAFSRISSRFNLSRKHPVLNKIRAHRGVDYAAPSGTPIKATGDGKVLFRGTKGGYGKTVIIQHGSAYSTLYAHMSRYARGSNRGKQVKQGQVIGYVGSSGLATGPHLHYEFRLNGAHRNPLTVKLPSAEPLPKKYRANFERRANQLIARLELVKQIQLAQK